MVVLRTLPVTVQKPVIRFTGDLTTMVNSLLARNMAEAAASLIINALEEGKDVSSSLGDNTLWSLAATNNSNEAFVIANDLILKYCERKIKLNDTIAQKIVINLRDAEPLLSLKLLSTLLDNDYSINTDTIEVSIVKLRDNYLEETADLTLSAKLNAKRRHVVYNINSETIEITLNRMLRENPQKAIYLLKQLHALDHQFSRGYIQRCVVRLSKAGFNHESSELLEEMLDKSFSLKTIEIAVIKTRKQNPELSARILIKALDLGNKEKGYIHKPVVENTVVILREKNPALALLLIRKAVETSKETYDFNPETINITLEHMLTDDKINDAVESINFFLDNNIFIDEILSGNNP
ncbi:MAG: hypothetical protein A3I68_06025 [Candidatus Melainabacteria bacterium RIFCSPLOWO2_02_FULL_35_15]|nr:MAG: hypothetical protein A3F80_02145 [Candidatus Melainabacteria bacterium RIFCSPLOWO2_12_FULL_35_11]OGI13760.1 MAG: hypothetical protein A3I68_06025 [Candidatus Melainabacteria bacterium RIFCSPLOWO2_02_FULL_35_15]